MNEKKTKIIKSNGKNSPVIGDNGLKTLPGDNSRYAKIALDMVSWEPVDRNDIPGLQKRFEEYIQYCIDNDVKPGNLTCYAALGISKQVAMDWETGRYGSKEHVDFIKKVKSFCSSFRELLMLDNKVNVVTGIFWQKNYDGLVDKQEYVLTPNQQNDNDYSADEIRERYIASDQQKRLTANNSDEDTSD